MADSGTNLGKAYFTLMPTMTGVASSIGKELGGSAVKSKGKAGGNSIGASMASGIGSGIKAGAVAIGSVVSEVAMAAAASLGSTFADAIDLSDAMKKFGTTMEFAGFDAETIEIAKQQVKDYADQTVYDLSTVANTVAQLGANGVDEFVGLTMAAGNLNAVAGGNAATFESVAMVLTQTAGAGKLTTENWNQLADAIPGASGVLQDALREAGAYTGDFRTALENGEISAEEFNAAIISLGWKEAAWKASTSTKTMEGALGNFSAAVTGSMSEVYDAINGDGRITSAITGLGDSLGTMIRSTSVTLGLLTTRIEGIFATGDPATIASGLTTLLSEGVTTAMTSITTIIPTVMEKGAQIARGIATGLRLALPDIITSFGSLVSVGGASFVSGAATIVATFAANLITGLPAITNAAALMLSGIVRAIPDVITNLLSSVQMLVSMVALNLPSFASSLISGAVTLFGSIATAVPQVLTSVTTAIGGLLSSVATAFPTLATTLAADAPKLFQAIVDAVPTLLDSISTALTSLMDSLGTTLPTLASGLTTAAPTLFSGIISAVPGLLTSLIMGFLNLVTSFIQNFPTFALAIANTAGTLFTGIVDALPGIWESLKTAFSALVTNLTTEMPTKLEDLKAAAASLFVSIVTGLSDQAAPLLTAVDSAVSGVMTGLAEWASSVLVAGQALWQNIVDAVTNKVETLKTEVSTFIQGALDKIAEFDVLQVGIDLVQGFIDGVKSMAQSVIDNVTSVFTDPINSVKNFFGIASPSKLMFEFGGFVDQGFANGIAAYADLATDAMAEMSAEAIGALETDVDANLAFQAAGTSPVGNTTYNISIDGMSATADGGALDLLREFVAGVVEVNGGRRLAYA